jgi:hypothetical protein
MIYGALILYFIIGFLLGTQRVSNYRMGTKGPWATIAAYTLVWPLILVVAW